MEKLNIADDKNKRCEVMFCPFYNEAIKEGRKIIEHCKVCGLNTKYAFCDFRINFILSKKQEKKLYG